LPPPQPESFGSGSWIIPQLDFLRWARVPGEAFVVNAPISQPREIRLPSRLLRAQPPIY
jgi:hypothetical protein